MCEYDRSDGRVLIGVSHGYVNWQNVSKEPTLRVFITDVVSNGRARSGPSEPFIGTDTRERESARASRRALPVVGDALATAVEAAVVAAVAQAGAIVAVVVVHGVASLRLSSSGGAT